MGCGLEFENAAAKVPLGTKAFFAMAVVAAEESEVLCVNTSGSLIFIVGWGKRPGAALMGWRKGGSSLAEVNCTSRVQLTRISEPVWLRNGTLMDAGGMVGWGVSSTRDSDLKTWSWGTELARSVAG